MTPLEPGQLWLMRIHAILAASFILLAAAIAELTEGIRLPHGAIILPLLLPLLYVAFISPGRRYRAWGYRMDAEELQLRHGVWTQMHTIVPLCRIQHIDLSQGPLERALGVCRLIVHTAGTLHSRVHLPGLSRATAEAMRDEIRGRIGQEAE